MPKAGFPGAGSRKPPRRRGIPRARIRKGAPDATAAAISGFLECRIPGKKPRSVKFESSQAWVPGEATRAQVKSDFYGGCRPAAGPFVGRRLWKIEAHRKACSACGHRAATTPKRGFQMRIVSRPEEGVAQPVGANEFWRYLCRGSESQGGI